MNIVIAPIHKSFFSGRIWMGLDIEKIEHYLNEISATYKVQIIDFSILSNDYSLIPLNAFLFYTASYNDNYQQYIKDVVFDISFSRPDVILLPNLDQLFSFENKGYQELLKRRLNIENVKGSYIGDLEDYLHKQNDINFPIVLKTLKGAMSSGVQLIKNKKQLIDNDSVHKKMNFKEYLIYKRREWKKTKETNLDFLNLLPNLNLSLVNFNIFFQRETRLLSKILFPIWNVITKY